MFKERLFCPRSDQSRKASVQISISPWLSARPRHWRAMVIGIQRHTLPARCRAGGQAVWGTGENNNLSRLSLAGQRFVCLVLCFIAGSCRKNGRHFSEICLAIWELRAWTKASLPWQPKSSLPMSRIISLPNRRFLTLSARFMPR